MNSPAKYYLKRFLKGFIFIIVSLLLAISFHELSHYASAKIIGLEPSLKITAETIGITVEPSQNMFLNRLVNISGVLANLAIATVSVLILFLLHFHNLFKKENDYDYKAFLILLALANLLLVLFTFLAYPYQGVL